MPAYVYRNADDLPHPGLWNLKEASAALATHRETLRAACARGEVAHAFRKEWRIGITHRAAWFATPDAFIAWMGRKAANRALKRIHHGNNIENR